MQSPGGANVSISVRPTHRWSSIPPIAIWGGEFFFRDKEADGSASQLPDFHRWKHAKADTLGCPFQHCVQVLGFDLDLGDICQASITLGNELGRFDRMVTAEANSEGGDALLSPKVDPPGVGAVS